VGVGVVGLRAGVRVCMCVCWCGGSTTYGVKASAAKI